MPERAFNNAVVQSGGVIPDGDQVAAHFGNPFLEEEALRKGRAFTDLSFLEAVQVTGPDTLRWLHSFSTADFEHAHPGSSMESLILDPNGHIDFASAVCVGEDSVLFIVDSEQSSRMFDFLESMKFMLRVEVSLLNIVAFGVEVAADHLSDKLRDVACAVWEDPWPITNPGGAHYGIPDAEHPAFGRHRTLIIAAENNYDAVRSELLDQGFSPAGLLAWEASRIVDLRPRPATEIVNRSLPHELDWIRTAVHLNKGCYRGQETVAKLVNLGRPPRRLVFLYLEGEQDELPCPGDDVKLGSRPVGVVTSSALDYEAGPVALALIKRSVKLNDVLNVGNFVATQDVIVSPEGKSSVSPAERPGAELR